MNVFFFLIVFGSLNDFCDGCNVGYYGEFCSKECPKSCHDNECNVTTGKCLSCMKGHYRDYNKDCVLCPEHCTACSSNKFCFACKRGFRGEVCEYNCTNCRPDTSCDKNTGYCFENCSEGRSGELCNIPCDSECKSCDRHNTDECILCANGYRLEKTCNQTDTVCNIRCKALTEMQPDRQGSSTTDIGLIVGLVIGFIIVAICVCIIVFIIVRRRRRRFRGMSGDRNRTPATNDEENVGLMDAGRTNETRELPSAEKLTVLQMLWKFSAIEKKYFDMKIKVAGNKVTVEGYPVDIENAFKEIDNNCSDIEEVEYAHSKSRDCLSFYQREQTIEYVKTKLKQKQLHGIWDITGTKLNVYVDGKGNSENFKNTILESVLEISEPVDKSLLSSVWWGEFLLDIGRLFQEKTDIFIKEQQTLIIICTDDVVHQVKQLVNEFLDGTTDAIRCEPGVCEFVSKYWTQDDFDEIRKNGAMIMTGANGFELRGLLDKLNRSKQELNKKLRGIISKKYGRRGLDSVLVAVKHSGTINDIAKECRCVIKLPREMNGSPSLMLCDHEVVDSDILEEKQKDWSTNASPVCFQTRRHGIKIQLIQGDIRHQKADIIVVEEASNLDPKSDSGLNSSLKQFFHKLTTDYKRLYPNGIQDGEVAVIDSRAYNCGIIYLTSLPPWPDVLCNGGKILRNFMRECLRLADKYDKNTIAFSSMVTGVYLGYPVDLAVSILYGAVVEFDSSYSKTSLKEINIVINNEDDVTRKAFKDHEYKRIYGASSVGSLSTDFVGGRIKIELVDGDISTQKVDAIVCSLSEEMDINRSVICQSLVQNPGKSLQDELEQICRNKLDVGTVVTISDKSLQIECKTVFLAVLSTYTENKAEQSWITTLQTVFNLANSKGYKSLAIAAIETGYLNYPETTAAKCIYDAVIEWVINNQNASLNVVRIVMYSKDTDAQQTYRLCHLKTQCTETRNKRIFIDGGTIFIKPEEDSKFRMVKDGCAIGPMQLQVQVGDILNNTANVRVIGVGANCGTKEQVLKKDGIIITPNDELETKYTINVQFQDSLGGWRAKLVDCLEAASKKSIQSIAFPLLESGAGPKTFPADCIGACLFAAIYDFTSQNPKSSLTDVRLVVPDSVAGCVPAIIAALQDRTTAVNFQWGIGKMFKSKLGCVADSNQFNESSITVYSDATINVDRCIKALDDRIGLEFVTKVVDARRDVISSLKVEEINSLIDSDILIDVKFDEQTSKFSIVGPLRNVMAAVTCLRNKMRHYNSAKVLYDQTKWHWQCEDRLVLEKEVPYDMMPNFVIETAYRNGQQTVELQSKDGKIYVIDFQKLVEYPKLNIYDTVMVIRKDVLKDIKTIMPQIFRNAVISSYHIERVLLQKGDTEYMEIEKRFLKEVGNYFYGSKVKKEQSVQHVEVVKIERFENRALYEQYKAKKKQMTREKSGCKQTKRELWHGATEESIPKIVNNGFNRSYCGVHESSYGQGVYFAADASYSAHSYLAENKPGAKRYMFLAKVLTGKLIKGDPSMRVLRPVNPAEPTITYDSAVDDINNPMEFVIFHVTQAYPKYLITYKLY